MTMYGSLRTRLYIYIYIKLKFRKKIQLESKLDFTFVSFP